LRAKPFFPTVPYFTAHVLAPYHLLPSLTARATRGTPKSQNPDRSQPQHRPQHNTQRSHRKSNIGIKSGGVGYPTFRPRATQSARVLTQTDLMGSLQIGLTPGLHRARATIKSVWVKPVCALQIEKNHFIYY